MTVTYRNTFGDRVRFAAYHLPRNWFIQLITVGFVLLFNYTSLIPALRESSVKYSLLVNILTFFFMEVFLVAGLLVFWGGIILVTMISRWNKPLYCERTLTLSPEMFSIESPYGNSQTRWTLIQKLARTRRLIILYLNRDSAVIVPRRAFINDAAWESFFEQCRQGVSAAKGKV